MSADNESPRSVGRHQTVMLIDSPTGEKRKRDLSPANDGLVDAISVTHDTPSPAKLSKNRGSHVALRDGGDRSPLRELRNAA